MYGLVVRGSACKLFVSRNGLRLQTSGGRPVAVSCRKLAKTPSARLIYVESAPEVGVPVHAQTKRNIEERLDAINVVLRKMDARLSQIRASDGAQCEIDTACPPLPTDVVFLQVETEGKITTTDDAPWTVSRAVFHQSGFAAHIRNVHVTREILLNAEHRANLFITKGKECEIREKQLEPLTQIPIRVVIDEEQATGPRSVLQCRICMDNEVRQVCKPCGHAFCTNCAKRMKQCGYCKTRVVEYNPVIVS